MSEKKEVEPRATVRIPAGHFNQDGVSQGKSTGPVRGPDAYQGKREEHPEEHPRAR